MTTIFTGPFWIAAAERSIKASAWSLAATLGAGQIGVLDADWPQALSVAAMAGVLSLLGSVGSDAISADAGPSLVNAEVLGTAVAAQDDGDDLIAGPAAPGIREGAPVDVVPDVPPAGQPETLYRAEPKPLSREHWDTREGC